MTDHDLRNRVAAAMWSSRGNGDWNDATNTALIAIYRNLAEAALAEMGGAKMQPRASVSPDHAWEPAPVSVRDAARVLLDALNEGSELDVVIQTAMQEETDADGTDEWVFVLRAGLRAIAEGKDDE